MHSSWVALGGEPFSVPVGQIHIFLPQLCGPILTTRLSIIWKYQELSLQNALYSGFQVPDNHLVGCLGKAMQWESTMPAKQLPVGVVGVVNGQG